MRLQAIILFTMAAAFASAASTTVGLPGEPVSVFTAPSEIFGMPTQGPDLRYRQVYSQDIFTKPVTITGIQFYSGFSTLTEANYEIYLATTPAPNVLPYWNPWSDPANSVLFYTGRTGTTLPDFSYETRTFNFSGNPFYYDPSQGDLTVIIHGSDYGTSTFSRMLGISDGSAPFDFMLAWSSGATYEYGSGMATTFITADPSDVSTPEPATVCLTGLLLMAGVGLRSAQVRRTTRSSMQCALNS